MTPDDWLSRDGLIRQEQAREDGRLERQRERNVVLHRNPPPLLIGPFSTYIDCLNGGGAIIFSHNGKSESLYFAAAADAAKCVKIINDAFTDHLEALRKFDRADAAKGTT